MKTFVMSKTIDDTIRDYQEQIEQSNSHFQARLIRDHALNYIEQVYHRSRQAILHTFDQQIKKKNISKHFEICLNSIDFDFDHRIESIASFSSSTTNDSALAFCENEVLIYSQNGNQLIVSSSRQLIEFDQRTFIRALCFVEWLSKCLVIANDSIYLLDYRNLIYELLEVGSDYRCGVIDNLHERFYLIKQSTLCKYDRTCLQADQYPIADGYECQSVCLDNRTNDSLALLVRNTERRSSILVYSTANLSNGYLYKILFDDCLERTWICSSEDRNWFIRGISDETCFEVNYSGLKSFRRFQNIQIINLVHLIQPHCYLIRTKTDIFLLKSKKIFSIKT